MSRDGYGKGAVSAGKLGFKTGTKAVVELLVSVLGISGHGNK